MLLLSVQFIEAVEFSSFGSNRIEIDLRAK